eukprot:58840_1
MSARFWCRYEFGKIKTLVLGSIALIEPIRQQNNNWDMKTQEIWNECENTLPQFDTLYGVMAHSDSTVFPNIWQEMLSYYNEAYFTKDQLRYFEIGVSIVSILNKCHFCIQHHATENKFASNLSNEWNDIAIDYLQTQLKLNRNNPSLSDIHQLAKIIPNDTKDSIKSADVWKEYLIMKLAYHLCYYVAYGRDEPKKTYTERHILWTQLDNAFGDDKHFLESLIWRLSQCIAFNAHNDFLEL